MLIEIGGAKANQATCYKQRLTPASSTDDLTDYEDDVSSSARRFIQLPRLLSGLAVGELALSLWHF